MLMLYDEVNQSDFVGAFDERCALEARRAWNVHENRWKIRPKRVKTGLKGQFWACEKDV